MNSKPTSDPGEAPEVPPDSINHPMKRDAFFRERLKIPASRLNAVRAMITTHQQSIQAPASRDSANDPEKPSEP
jgi:hypothetical protein